QSDPRSPVTLEAIRVGERGQLAVRASKKLIDNELLVTRYAGTRLRMDLDRVLWPQGQDHISIRQLAEYYASYPYLQRLRDPDVLLEAVRDGVSQLLWRDDTFAYADGFDETAGRYRGLRAGQA